MEELHRTNIAEKLQQELAIRAKYYFKGFGSYLQGLLADLDNLVEIGRTPEREQHTREMIDKMVNLYQSIPFEQITDHPDYALLLQIREAISKLVPKVEAVLSGENSIDGSLELIKIISEKGMEYRARLSALLKQINSQSGHEKDGFDITDIHGKVWKYPF